MTPRQRVKRTRIATGCYSDQFGISVVVRGKEHRYPLGTPTDQLVRDRRQLIADAGAPSPVRAHTLAADIAAYLATIPEGRARREATTLLQHWIDAGYGKQAPAAITPIAIRQQLAAWAKRFSAKHRNNLLHGLRAVYRATYGATLNPAQDVRVQRVRYADPRAIPADLIRRILDGMPARGQPRDGKVPAINLAQLRLRVMATTGLSQAMLRRIEPADLELRKKTVYVRMRLKGRGVIGATLPLTDAGAAALRALRDAGGLGPFSSRSLAYCWRRAVMREKRNWEAQEAKRKHPRRWPLGDDVRAYDLRHSFGTAVLLATGDLEATATLLRHSNLSTTRRYVQAAAQGRARAAIDVLNRR